MNARTRTRELALTAAATIVLWQLPGGRYLLYPFTILATWFHEMGHGLGAMLMGGSFVMLKLFPDGSGFAVHAGTPAMGRLGLALVAAAGPLGPAVAGAALIFVSLRPRWSRFALTTLAIAMLCSALVWVRTLFGVGVIGLLALGLLLVRVKGDGRWHSASLQVIGVQACISVFLQVGYLFTEKIVMSGQVVYSDTGQIAAALFLPYWFWAIMLAGVTLWLPAWSLSRALPRS